MKHFFKLSIFVAFLSNVALAGPVISGGGTQSVKEARGEAHVVVIRGSALLNVDGEAARILFESLNVTPLIPPYSTSVIKTLNSTQCTQNDELYSCVIGILTQERE